MEVTNGKYKATMGVSWSIDIYYIFILGWFGKELYRQVPPLPAKIQTTIGTVPFDKEDILTDQQVWQSIGGQQVGSIWGHGAYQAPDWSADWLHRELISLQDILSSKIYNQSFATLDAIDQAAVKAHLKQEIRTNTYDKTSGVVVISPERAQAIVYGSCFLESGWSRYLWFFH